MMNFDKEINMKSVPNASDVQQIFTKKFFEEKLMSF